MGGIFHAGVEVYGQEYMYGAGEAEEDEDVSALCFGAMSGVSTCQPRSCSKHGFRQAECLGLTTLAEKDVEAMVKKLARKWLAKDYRILERNCVTFCRSLCQNLDVETFPAWIDSMALAASERQTVEPSVGSGFNANGSLEVKCYAGHICKHQAQSFLGGLVMGIICEACERELGRGEPHWRCETCDLEVCDACLSNIQGWPTALMRTVQMPAS